MSGLISPLWLSWLWAAGSAACLALAGVIVWRRLLPSWPSLCLSVTIEAVVFCLQQPNLRANHYRAFFFIYWIHAAVQSVLRITIFRDLFRSLPAGSLIPRWLQTASLLLGSIAAIVVTIFLLYQPTARGLQYKVGKLDEVIQLAWAAMLVFLFYGVSFSGFGFTMTGVRVATAYILRIIVTAGVATEVNAKPSQQKLDRLSGIQTAAGLLFAGYCIFAMIRDRDSLRLTEDAADPNKTPHELLSSIEKAGSHE